MGRTSDVGAPRRGLTDEEINRAVARIHVGILAMVGAVMGGAGLFVATAWLLIRGGEQVGPHLGLLAWYFYGYTVTWPGAFVGLFWGALTGGVIGWITGTIYNAVVRLRH